MIANGAVTKRGCKNCGKTTLTVNEKLRMPRLCDDCFHLRQRSATDPGMAAPSVHNESNGSRLPMREQTGLAEGAVSASSARGESHSIGSGVALSYVVGGLTVVVAGFLPWLVYESGGAYSGVDVTVGWITLLGGLITAGMGVLTMQGHAVPHVRGWGIALAAGIAIIAGFALASIASYDPENVSSGSFIDQFMRESRGDAAPSLGLFLTMAGAGVIGVTAIFGGRGAETGR
jgi:hypothetical protein